MCMYGILSKDLSPVELQRPNNNNPVAMVDSEAGLRAINLTFYSHAIW